MDEMGLKIKVQGNINKCEYIWMSGIELSIGPPVKSCAAICCPGLCEVHLDYVDKFIWNL